MLLIPFPLCSSSLSQKEHQQNPAKSPPSCALRLVCMVQIPGTQSSIFWKWNWFQLTCSHKLQQFGEWIGVVVLYSYLHPEVAVKASWNGSSLNKIMFLLSWRETAKGNRKISIKSGVTWRKGTGTEWTCTLSKQEPEGITQNHHKTRFKTI